MPQINICVWHEIGNNVQYFLYGYSVLALFGEKCFITQWVSWTFSAVVDIVGFRSTVLLSVFCKLSLFSFPAFLKLIWITFRFLLEFTFWLLGYTSLHLFLWVAVGIKIYILGTSLVNQWLRICLEILQGCRFDLWSGN